MFGASIRPLNRDVHLVAGLKLVGTELEDLKSVAPQRYPKITRAWLVAESPPIDTKSHRRSKTAFDRTESSHP
jgi:hypothetical protein